MTRGRVRILALLAGLAFAPSLRAQYQWHVVHADRADTLYYGFASLSCAGESCSCIGVVWGYNPGEKPYQQMPDSNFILTSTDGGQSWAGIPSGLPAWHYSANGKSGLIYQAADQIDSLNAVVVGSHSSVLRTSDHWQTWQADTGLHLPMQGSDTLNLNFQYLNFSNPAEGAVNDNAEGYSVSTVDSGKHWIEKKDAGYWDSYGSGEFRSFIWPDTLITTTNDWNSTDTSIMRLDGPFSGDSVQPISLLFGAGDTLAYVGYRTDASGNLNTVIALSTNLGEHWTELPLPRDNGINPATAEFSPIIANTIVIGGMDTSEHILISTDRGASWQEDTVPFPDGTRYKWISAVAVTGSGRVLASIQTDNGFEGSQVLAYLEKTSSSVAPAGLVSQPLRVYPNPATGLLNIESAGTRIAVFDPLGRSYAVRREGSALDISALPPGVYFISDGHSRTRFVKE